MGPWEEHGCTSISDRQNGLVEAMAKLLPRAEHRGYCVRHLSANLRTHYRGKELKDMLWNCARSSTDEGFNENTENLRAKDEDAFNYLNIIPRAQWPRCGFRTTSNSNLLEK
ncbi:uncharacterized protein A4U43_C08F18300 [Asparagus officinalis]|nr:uncharacterized protein A4U43_C08F18300 [Asparagus officinalis]